MHYLKVHFIRFFLSVVITSSEFFRLISNSYKYLLPLDVNYHVITGKWVLRLSEYTSTMWCG